MVINCGLIAETSEYDSWDTIDSHLKMKFQIYRKGCNSSADSYAEFLLQHLFFWPCKTQCSQNHKMFRLEGTSGVFLSIPLWSSRANWVTCIQQAAEYQTRKFSPLLQLINFLTSLTKKRDRQWQHLILACLTAGCKGQSAYPTLHPRSSNLTLPGSLLQHPSYSLYSNRSFCFLSAYPWESSSLNIPTLLLSSNSSILLCCSKPRRFGKTRSSIIALA